MEALELDLATYSKDGNCLICGDFNGRTCTEPDFCDNDATDEVIELPYHYIQDMNIPRSNSDKSKPDKNGSKLLDLCKASGMRIVNGRCLGDSLGYFTCFSHTGAPSMIDYMLASRPLFRDIEFFHVSDPGPVDHSIHCSLSLHLKTHPYSVNLLDKDDTLHTNFKQYKWSEGDGVRYQMSILNPSIQASLKLFSETQYNTDSDSINNAVENFSSILICTANLAKIKNKKSSKRHNQKPKKRHKWYTENCRHVKNTLINLGKQLRQSPYDTNKIQTFRSYRKMYKKLVRNSKRKYQQQILNNLESMNNNNPRAFWETYKELHSLDAIHKENPIPAKDWITHFTSLMNKAVHSKSTEDSTFDKYVNDNKDKIFNDLNFRIQDNEIAKAIANLKIKKSGGIDGILNEMLKASMPTVTSHLNKLFNLILTSGTFPECWRINTLTPLHKKGSNLLPENYRGIAVGSNLSKLFCSILHNRLANFITEHNLIPNNQIGYKKNARTVDHILTLKNIIDKYIFKLPRKYLFVCFVDFKSAFDTVWRNALFYKLLLNDIGGNFLSVIQSMSNNVYYCVKMKSGITNKIPSNVGVKQGCVLSPTLFNLYLADLPDIFDDSCDPIMNFDTTLSCLMFADDIILMSESADGLQKCIDKLHSYCDKWSLTLNTKKTQVLIFNKGGHSFKRFKFNYGNIPIEITQKYCYLGILFSACGTFTAACQNILNKSLKVFFKLKQLDTRDNVKLTLKLFDSLVTPVIMYGCEIWAPLLCRGLNSSNFMHLCDSSVLEKVNIKLCKYVLGVSRKSTNAAVRGELGRYPIMLRALSQSVNYWMRLGLLPIDNLVRKSYLDTLVTESTEITYWSHCIHSILSRFNMDQVWEYQGMMGGSA
jgi:hypothetical protein